MSASFSGLNAGSYKTAPKRRNAVARYRIVPLGYHSRYGERLRAHPFQRAKSPATCNTLAQFMERRILLM